MSILRLSKGVFEVLATGGDSALGGDDFDHLLAEYLLDQAGVKAPLSPEQHRTILNLATETKIELSDKDSVDVEVLGWTGKVYLERV